MFACKRKEYRLQLQLHDNLMRIIRDNSKCTSQISINIEIIKWVLRRQEHEKHQFSIKKVSLESVHTVKSYEVLV